MKMTVTLVFLLVFVASSIAEPNSDGPAGEKLHQYHSDVGMNPLAEYSYSFQPMHVHLAYGADTSEVVVTWSTRAKEAGSIVNWGTSMFRLDKATNGTSKLFEDATKTNVQYIHRVHLMDLAPNTTFFYQVGGGSGWSSVFGFKTVPAANTEWPLRFAAYGDLGVVNAKSLTRLQKEAHMGMYDLILHVGDFAYNMYEENGTTGDEFMDQIQPIAAYLPYMTCPGNHENSNNFLQYRSRFSMPNYPETESIYYSFDVGPVHFISISTERYFFGTWQDLARQWVWLKNDLEEANKPENRKLRPWIVINGHRPMYCSNDDADDCQYTNSKIRVGFKWGDKYEFGIEDLMLENHVDVAFWAHEHSYERFYPIYNYTYYNQADAYNKPKAPVHITSGSAGCRENHSGWVKEMPPYSAKRFSDYGYTKFTVHNTTHLHMEQVDAEDATILDDVWIVRHEGNW